MALTPSSMLPLGTVAPDFDLLDTVTQKKLSLQQLKSDMGTVVMFICNHCPYVQHILTKLLEITVQYQAKGIQFIAINSNDTEKYPADHPQQMRELAVTEHFTFPFLFDETQQVAQKYGAACTPDFFVFDKDLKCVYRGRFDDSSPGKLHAVVTGNELSLALDNLLAGKPINPNQYPSIGCNIKWKNS